MTEAWLALPALLFSQPQDGINVDQIDDKLIVEWRKKRIETHPRRIIFSEGVTARYGVTVVKADTLTLYLEDTEKRGEAQGHVHVDDPEGTIDASDLNFNWRDNTGSARDVTVMAGRIHVQAEAISIKPDEWVLIGAYGTPCDEGTPAIAMRAKKVVVKPGVKATAERASFYLFGSKLITLPKYSFALRKGAPGMRLPSFSYRSGAGVGVAWNSAFSLGQSTGVSAGFRAFPKDLPSANLELAHSLIPPAKASGILIPRSDLEEHFGFGYFENVYVRSPQEEWDYVGGRRTNIGVGTAWNLTPNGRRTEPLFTKPWEVTLEDGRKVGGLNLMSQVRYQSLRANGGPTESRGVGYVSASLPPLSLGSDFYTNIRFDGTSILDQGSDFGWGRAQLGLIYRPSSKVRFGAAFNFGGEYGTPRFESDRLFSTRSFHIRGDFDLGATKISWLSKYDIPGKRWYDHELGLTQVAGCFEPYIVLRKFPRSTSFGLRIRADNLFEALQKRTHSRKPQEPAKKDY